jgi:hypothetical protein
VALDAIDVIVGDVGPPRELGTAAVAIPPCRTAVNRSSMTSAINRL